MIAFDNLKRRGSELSVRRLQLGGVKFHHGDVRIVADIEAAGRADLLIECAPEPSVHAGYGENPSYLISTNLGSTINCLEHLRRHGGDPVFLSTSRIYPIGALRDLPLERQASVLSLQCGAAEPGTPLRGSLRRFH